MKQASKSVIAAANESDSARQYRETVEAIAGNIKNLAMAVSSLLNGPLNRRTLVILLASSSRQSQETVRDVLGALENLQKDWLNK